MLDIAVQASGLSKRYHIARRAAADEDAGAGALSRLTGRFVRRETREEFWAVRDVSFSVPQGEVFGIIGRNGAGKSTLLKILSRITEPTCGSVELYGRVASLLEVGTGFNPELTGRENVYLNGAILGMGRREIERKFDEIVAFAGVERFLDTPVKRYSSGMYLRLAFAVAAHLDPEILIVDEVLAVGDASFQEKCIGKMGEVGRQGRTVLLVSHNMASISALCRNALMLQDGQVVKMGTAGEVVSEYLARARETGARVQWTDAESAPGNEKVRLEEVRVTQAGGTEATDVVEIGQEVEIRATYRVYEPGVRLYSAIWLKDALGTVVFASSNSTTATLTPDDWYGVPRPAGLYETTCRIPGNFLNDGRYSVTVDLGMVPIQPLVHLEDLLTFQVNDTGEMRGEYLGKWIGVIRPRLAWATEPLSAG